MRLAGLSRGGDERASVHGGELRNVRDWELLKDEQALAAEGKGMSASTLVQRLHGILKHRR